jgi:DNA-binding beta-propeller fold protein YncE
MHDVSRPGRLSVLALAFLIAACAAQTVAPRPSETPSGSATATAKPTNRANDVVYLRSLAPGPVASILAIDARTGNTLRTLPDGYLSPDRATLYAPELTNGATQTLVHVIEFASEREVRSFAIPNAYHTVWGDGTHAGLSRDGRHMVLSISPSKIDTDWLTSFKVVDVSTGAVEASFETKEQSTFGFEAISPDGRSLFLSQFGEGATGLRVFDVPSATLLPVSAIAGGNLAQRGFRTPGVLSVDGRWLYGVDAGTATTNCTSTDGPSCIPNATPPAVLALDLLGRRLYSVALPKEQISTDFEKYLVWSVGLAPSGDRVYAINPALGVVDEVDVRAFALGRTGTITVSRTGGGVWAALGQFLFPVAEAKRWITSGAVFSPDGSLIYAVATKGIAVVDAATLTSRATWQSGNREFDGLALSADGERLYAMSNANGVVSIIAARDGSPLGEFKLPYGGQTLLHIESPR